MFFIASTGLTDFKTTEKVGGTYFISDVNCDLAVNIQTSGKSILSKLVSHLKHARTEWNQTYS